MKKFDAAIAQAFRDRHCFVDQNFAPFDNNKFNVDIAIPDHKLLIEIEKGRLPRLELDIFKMASACWQSLDKWRYGALIVPASYIKLPLAGRNNPYDYLKHLAQLIKPMFSADQGTADGPTMISGLVVIGYFDPREGS